MTPHQIPLWNEGWWHSSVLPGRYFAAGDTDPSFGASCIAQEIRVYSIRGVKIGALRRERPDL